MLKKINAGLSLFTVIVLIAHMCVAMQAINGIILPVTDVMPVAVMILMIIHVLISMAIMAFAHDGHKTKYPGKNIATIIQRASGVLMLIPLFVTHTRYFSEFRLNQTLFFILEIFFFILVFAHIVISVPRACITLGLLKNEKAVKICGIITLILSVALVAVSIISYAKVMYF